MLAPSRKRPLPLLVVLAVAVLLFIFQKNDCIRSRWASYRSSNVEIPANRTLGFGAIVVVSKEGSARRHALLQAANVTDIELTIPQQPQWTESEGSLLAWMGHLNVLQWSACGASFGSKRY
jgi:hypothetical protein